MLAFCVVFSAAKLLPIPSLAHRHCTSRNSDWKSSGELPISISQQSQYTQAIPSSIMSISGGEVSSNPAASPSAEQPNFSLKRQLLRNVLGVWGVAQVISVLANAVKRLIPVAIQPLQQNDLQPWQWGLYVTWSMYMVYAEGYKAFQKKFSPMVVQRAFSIIDKPSILNVVLAGPYCMGMFGASRKRMIVSWAVTAGVFSLVKIVKLLPYPYRAIVDAGVVLGLSYGALSMLFFTVKALLGGKVDAGEKEE